MSKTNFSIEELLENVIEGAREKKAKEVMMVDMREMPNPFCDYFVICHGDSDTQVEAIAQSVEFNVKKKIGEKTWHKSGYENAQWVLLDYGDIIVHVFQEAYRRFYNLEDLWADAKLTEVEDNISITNSN